MKSLIATLAVLVLSTLALGQDFGSFDARLTNVEHRLASIEKALNVKSIGHDGKRTYAEAYQLALETGKPLVVWSGAAVCPPCVTSTEGTEFINYVGDVDGCTPNAITVGVAGYNDGIDRIATITTWQTGDPQFGHVPSIRRALDRWRTRHERTNQATQLPANSYQIGSTAFGFGGSMMGGGMMAGGGCASCGTASRGFFRR